MSRRIQDLGLSTWKEDSIAGIGETRGSALRNTIYLVIVCSGSSLLHTDFL